MIEYTGGTTGKAKGVLISNGAANAVAFQYIVSDNLLDFEPGQRLLGIIPPFLAYGVFWAAYAAVCGAGGRAFVRIRPRAVCRAVCAL